MKTPRLARLLLWRILPPSEREFFLGDLDEEFQQQLAQRGLRGAQRWYWKQVFEAPGWWFRTSPDLAPAHAEVQKGEIMLSVVQDFRYACRSLAKGPSLTIPALVALALGIGANTAVFSVVNGILLKPLPYAVPERLVRLWDSNPSANLSAVAVAPGNFFAWQQQNRVFDGMGAYREDGFSIGSDGGAVAERVNGARVTAGLLPALGVSPLFGRWFTVDEDRPGAARVVLLGHDLWQRRFAGDRNIIGRAIRIEGEAYTVLGVMPPGFRVPMEGAELWVPFAIDPAQTTDRSSHFLRVLARLKSSTTAEQARVDLNRIAEQLDMQETESRRGIRVLLVPLTESITGDVGSSLWIMLGAVGLVLLIASANVANLLLARSVSRRREIALRLSLGASRGRLFRQMLSESLMLAVAGGGAGFVTAGLGIHVLRAQAPTNIPRLADVSLSFPVLAFTALVSIATGLLFGAVPALRGSRMDLGDGLKAASRGTTASRRDRVAGRVLVVAQITIAMVVVISSGLMLRTLWNLHSVDPGFQTRGRFTFGINLNGDRYLKDEARARLIATMIERLRAIPGVRNAAATHRLPMTGNSILGMEIEDRPTRDGQRSSITYRSVTSDYFTVMGIPLLRGRSFDRRESEAGGPVVIVNQRMASQFWPGEDPIGKRMRTHPNAEWLTVVGVVADSKESTLDTEARIGMYLPYFNAAVQAMMVIVDAPNSMDSIVRLIVPEMQKLDPDLAIAAIRPLDDVVDASIAERSFTAALLTVFAGIALLLASSGLYGVLAYTVNQRVREIGVRMALGATPRAVLTQIVGDGMRLIVPGIMIGVVAALAGARLLSRLLFGVAPEDPLTFLLIATFLALAGIVACLIPARRAASVDPIVALRNE